MKYAKAVLAAASALAMATALTACAGSDSAGGPPGSGGKVVIGIKYDQPGLGLKEGDTFTGFDVEVAKYVANKLGYTDIEFKEAPSPQRETLLESGQVKMIFATYSITDARKERISFAGPYFIAGQDLLVSATSDITVCMTSSRASGSRSASGSSSMRIRGRRPSVTARATRVRCPPESVLIRASGSTSASSTSRRAYA